MLQGRTINTERVVGRLPSVTCGCCPRKCPAEDPPGQTAPGAPVSDCGDRRHPALPGLHRDPSRLAALSLLLSLSLQLATQAGSFRSLPSPSGKTGRRPRSSEGHFPPQHFHRTCWGDELHRRLDAGSWLDGPPARLSGSTFSLPQLSHRACREAGEHGETPQSATSGVSGRKAGAAAPGRAGSQASRQPSTRRCPPPRRASPTRGRPGLEAVRVPSGRRLRPPARQGRGPAPSPSDWSPLPTTRAPIGHGAGSRSCTTGVT